MSSSVKKAFEIIEHVAERQGSVRQVDITKDLNMKKATAHRYFEVLEKLDILEKRENNYYLGLGLLRLGNKVQGHNLVLNRITPFLERIVSEVNETVNLAQFTNNSVTYLYRVESNRNLQLRAQPGDKLPFNCTSLGKAILSLLPNERVEEIITSSKLKEYTESTLINVKKIFKEVETIRETGYAVELEEFEEGLLCASVPLNFKKYNFLGALSISGTTNRMDKEKLLATLKRVTPIIDKLKKSFDA